MLAALAAAAPVSGAWAAQPGPVVSGLSPSSGPVAGGTAVTISGSGFTDATGVRFGGAAASFTVRSDGAIAATAPAGASGAVHVVVTTKAGSSSAGSADVFTYMPSVTDLSVSSGTVTGGTEVRISGSGFTGATSVRFGGRQADFSVASDGRIDVVSPPGDRGTVDVTVTSGGVTTPATAAGRFSYLLRVSGISPDTAAGGSPVHVTGIGFEDATAVHFGSSFAGFAILSDTELIAVAPNASGAVDVTVTTPHGTTDVVAAARFTYGGGTAAGASVSTKPGSSSQGSVVVTVSPTTSTRLDVRLVGGPSLTIPPRSNVATLRATVFLGHRATTVVSLVDPRGRIVRVSRTPHGKLGASVLVGSPRGGRVTLRVFAPAGSLGHGRRYTLVLRSYDAANRRATLRLPVTA